MNATTDWYDVEEVTPTVTEITDTPGVRIFLVTGEDRAIVVDAGRGIGDLRGLVEELTDLPHELVLTHWHWDHTGSAARFDDVRVHPAGRAPDGRVTIDALTDEFVDGPGNFVEDWLADGEELPDGLDPETFGVAPVPADRVEPLSPGAAIDLGDRSLEVFHVPGHTPDQLALLDRDAGVVIGADVIHRDRGLKLHFETGDVPAAQGTFAWLTDLWEAGAFDTLLTCHNPPMRGDDLELLRSFRDGLAEVMADERDYDVIDTGRTEAREYEIAGSQVLTRVDV